MRPLCVIQSPFATRSGYGDMARDIVRHIVELDRYDVKLISMPWGHTPMNALDESNPKDIQIIEKIVTPPIQLPRQPELFIQISVPNEFQAVGKYNIGITAGIETTLCSGEWIEGMNRMDLILTISEHSKRILENTVIEKRDSHTGHVIEQVKLSKPIEVLPNCIDTNIFKKISPKEISNDLEEAFKPIKEDFCFLFVGHWLKGNIGEDRKNVGLLTKVFCETFKQVKGPKPALILKTSGAGFSIMDEMEILNKIQQIRASCGSEVPNVYLLHGELTETQMNELYNHPKIKAHVSFTKGEGFGRPLLEATQSNKPVIASGWSGHLDFLTPDEAVLIGGELKNVEQSAVWPGVILAESQWFNIDVQIAGRALHHVWKNYGRYLDGALKLARTNREKFSYDVIRQKTEELFDKYVPKYAVPVPIQLPKLKKITNG